MHWIWIKLNFHLTLHKRNTDSNIFMSIYLKMRVSPIYQLCQSMPGTRQGQAGTRQGQTGPRQRETGRNKTNQDSPFISCLSLCVCACPCLSLSVPAFPYLSLYVPVCPCMSLQLLYLHFPLQITTGFIRTNILKLTLLALGHCSNAFKPFV